LQRVIDEKEKLEAQIDNLREQTWIPQRPVTFNKVIEMKEPEREAIKRLAKEPLPDVEEMLFELEQRFDALEARGALPIEIQLWVRGARDSIVLIRGQIILQLKHIQGKCDRIQAMVNRNFGKQSIAESAASSMFATLTHKQDIK